MLICVLPLRNNTHFGPVGIYLLIYLFPFGKLRCTTLLIENILVLYHLIEIHIKFYTFENKILMSNHNYMPKSFIKITTLVINKNKEYDNLF